MEEEHKRDGWLFLHAIHLELAYDVSTDSCIIAIRNFINRKGITVRLRSDNGNNFIAVNEEAKRFSEVFDAVKIQNEMSAKELSGFLTVLLIYRKVAFGKEWY